MLEFSPEHKYLRQFGQAGTGNGQFQGIGGIAVNKLGDVYVIDTGNHRIQEFSKEGAYITQFRAGSATAIAVDSQGTEGNVWVDALGPFERRPDHEVLALGHADQPVWLTGQRARTAGDRLRPGDLRPGHYVAELGRAQEFSTASEHFGEFVGQFDEQGSGNGKSNLPWGIATDPTTGNLFISEVGNDRVQEFGPSGSFITSFGSGGSGTEQLSDPQGLAVNSSGKVYVADAGNGRVSEFAAGEPPTFAGALTAYENPEAKLGQPTAVAIDPTTQDFWVAEGASDRVLEFSPEHKYLRQFGQAGTGNGQFQGIGGIAVNKLGDVYVIDTGNHRIQEFSKEGAYITQFRAGSATAIAVDSQGTEGNVWVDAGPL